MDIIPLDHRSIGGSIDRLQLFWTNFVQCENEEAKVKLLELFIFEYHSLINDASDFNPNHHRFLVNVASQLTCYLLQLVYGIICSSIATPSSVSKPLKNGYAATDTTDGALVAGKIINSDSIAFVSDVFVNNHDLINYTGLIGDDGSKKLVVQRSDITTIVALREFLVHGIGGRILEILLKVDTKNMLCARELSSLLVNLFPSNAWDNGGTTDLMHKEVIEDYGTLSNAVAQMESVKGNSNRHFDRSKFQTIATTPTRTHNRSEYDTNDYGNRVVPVPDLKVYETELLTSIGQTQFTCDYIGSIVLNLIEKLVAEECVTVAKIDQSSVTLQAFAFALETYCTLGQNSAFRPINRELFQRRLVTIMYDALRNVLVVADAERRDDLDEYLDTFSVCEEILRMLTTECRRDVNTCSDDMLRIKREHISAAVYFMFSILHKTLHLDDGMHYQQFLDTLKPQAIVLTQTFYLFVQHECQLLTKCLSIVFKLIRDVRSGTDDASGHSSKTSRRAANRRCLKRKAAQTTCTHHHRNTHELGCALERMLLSVAENFDTTTHLDVVYRFFRRNIMCCCNIDLQNIERLLYTSRRLRVQKSCLNFIKNNILKTIYSNVECSVCDERKVSFANDDAFVRLYRKWMMNLHPTELIVFLKHIAKISKYLPFDISCKIFVDVVLPPFRREKLHLDEMIESIDATTTHTWSKDIIINCLNVFVCYLRDVRLIKGFFNDENIQHIEDLIVVPELASLVCCVLKIGLENSSFLGENCGEQLVLFEQLRQIKCNSIVHVTEALVKFFDVLACTSVPALRSLDSTQFSELSPNRIVALLQSHHLGVQGLLHLAVVYWNMILQLMRANATTASADQHMFSTHIMDALVTVVLNSLSCFLYTADTAKTTEDSQKLLLDYSWISFGELNPSIEERCASVVGGDTLPLQLDTATDGHVPNSIFPTEIDFNAVLVDRNDDNAKKVACSAGNVARCHTTSDTVISTIASASSGFSFVFDVRNARSDSLFARSTVLCCTAIGADTVCVQARENVEIATVENANRLEDESGAPAVVHSLIKYVSDKVLDTIFASTDQSEGSDSVVGSGDHLVKPTNPLFHSDELAAVHLPEYKKLFTQLFEITCGVMMCSNSGDSNGRRFSSADSKMSRQSPLQELKAIMLQHSLHVHDSSENGTSIIAALQSLLKIAEMRYKCCFVENCAHATYSQAGGTDGHFIGGQYHPMNVAATTTVTTGGENQCCASSVPNTFDFIKTDEDDAFSSDIEQTEDDGVSSDDYYFTADDGYDGDAEQAANSAETEFDDDDDVHDDIKNGGGIESVKFSIQMPTSRYRNHIVHEEICRIVIDILIDLSKRCIDDPTFWPGYLLQIAIRFGTIRESIGGSLYLIKGFTPILECSDIRLRDFQKAILELITDINTPDALAAYLAIMTAENPPVDLLLPRLIYLGQFSHRVQPSNEIRFPTINDESIKSTCDPLMVKDIKYIHDYHDYHQMKTAFTRSTYIIPLNYIGFRPWSSSSNGFTVTTWIQIQPAMCGSQISSTEFMSGADSALGVGSSEAAISSKRCVKMCSQDEKTHLLSIGTNKLLLSIYMNSTDMSTLYFQLSKPNAQVTDKKLSKLSRSQTTDTIESSRTMRTRSPCNCTFRRKRKPTAAYIVPIHKEMNINQRSGGGGGVYEENKENISDADNEQPVGLNVLSTTYQAAIKSTRIAFRNSFSQFSLFSSTTAQLDNEFQSFRHPIEVKGLRLQKNKWTHLSFAVTSSGKEISVRISIDGLEQHDVHLPCSQNIKHEKFQLLCIGDKLSSTKLVEALNNGSHASAGDAESLLGGYEGLTYSLANVMVFKKSLTQPEVLGNLVALGPDCNNLTHCHIGNVLPNYGYLNPNKCGASTLGQSNGDATITVLRDQLIAVFSAHNPTVLLGYNANERSDAGQQMGLMTFGCPAAVKPIASLQSATILCGGLSPLLYLFARVVELSSCELIQSAALSFVLRTAHTHSTLYTEFVRKDYTSLIGPIIKSTKCIKGIYLLNSILESACDQPVLTKRADIFHVVTTTNACILYADLLVAIIHRYSDWHTPGTTASVIEVLLAALQALVREKHPKQNLNIVRLTRAGLVPSLLHFCKFYLVGIPQPVHLSRAAAISLVNLISIFAGAPPSSMLLDEIVKVLLLLHRPSDSFITHDPSKYYFLLSPHPVVKQKRLSLPLPTRRLSLSMRRERKKLTPVYTTEPPRMSTMRSISLVDQQTHSAECKVECGSPAATATTSSEGRGSECTELSEEPPKADAAFPVVCKHRLDAIVDYSRDSDRKTLNQYRALESCKLDKAMNQHRQLMQQQRQTLGKKRIVKRTRHRVKSRSSRATTTDSETDREAVRKKGSVSESGFEEDATLLIQEYDIIASEDIRRLEETFRLNVNRDETLTEMTSTTDGVIQIQNGFFNLLKDFILIFPDSSIQEVLAHYVTVDVVLVMANHHDASVRTSIVRLLTHMCQRMSDTSKQLYQKSHYWHHLGNQISLNPVSLALVQTCCQWLTGSCLPLDQIVKEPELKITEKSSMSVLIAIMPQTVHDLSVVEMTFEFIEKIYGTVATAEQRQHLIDLGLIPSVCKALSRFYLKWGTTNEKSVQHLQTVALTVAYKAIISAGTINILWDLLNSLSFTEENKNASIFRGLRATQAFVMHKLLQSFIPIGKTTWPASFKFHTSEINLANSTLSLAEKKTRFDLLVDRIVQFITTVEPSHQQTDAEVQLIQSIVLLSCTGYARGSNVVPWSLCPSRPMPLKMYTVKTLWRHTSRNGTLPSLGCDGKMVKSMVLSFYLTDRDIIPLPDLDVLQKVCNVLGILQTTSTISIPTISVAASSVSNLSQTLEKLEVMRETSLKDQKPAIERTVHKFESIVQPCIESAMKITRNVVELQNMERRILMNQMRAYDESGLAQEWKMLIERMTHEGAPWHCARNYPRSWRLDETEGPSRTRIRLKRCHVNVDAKFLMPDAQRNQVERNQDEPLAYLKSSLVQRPHFALNDQVLYTFACRHLPIDNEIEGEMIITELHLIFLANNLAVEPIQLNINRIMDIWLRRYQHRETGLEFCLDTNTSVLFIFQEVSDREVLIKYFADKVVKCPDEPKLVVLTQHWKEGQLTNWEYLMALNQISGRTFQDLMQYPVFPWILADYDSCSLNLHDPAAFRDLGKPIAIQHKESETHYINNFNYLQQAQEGAGVTSHMAPYHYGSHYSNSGTVLHFLVRVPPFTNFFLQYQDNSFDLPDRTFHSMQTTWRLASKESPTDVKELVPEFFTFPEMFENFESFNFGLRQSDEPVDHVALPAWSSNSGRLFVLMHRQALECDYVRSQLHRWIDLVFGYKQTGPAAVEAINVFHPATYIGFSSSSAFDPVVKKALETMVRTYGQMPRQLMREPHPMSTIDAISNIVGRYSQQIYPFVKGLRWGVFTGSPQLPEPKVCYFYQQFSEHFNRLLSLDRTNVCYAVPRGCNVMQGSEPDTMNIISWCESDGIVRIRPLNDNHPTSQPLLYDAGLDEISCCGTDPHSNQLWLGHKSGKLTVYQCYSTLTDRFNKTRFVQHSSSFTKMSYNSAFRKVSSKDIDNASIGNGGVLGAGSSSHDLNAMQWKEPVVLIRHSNEVTGIHLSNEFKIAVSISRDGFAIIWDTNKLHYVRCIQRASICNAPVTLVTISPTLGDIVTVHSVDALQPQITTDDIPNVTSTSTDCLEATESIDDDFVNVPIDLTGKSLLRLHTINAKYVNHVIDSDAIRACTYSSIKEGTGINVIATGYADGIVRLWSSWDLTLVKEIHVGGKVDVISLTYSTYQHLVVLTSDNIIQVWESLGLTGNPPKFPQLVFNKRRSV